MLFLCEIPSVVGWRAVTRLQCFNPWLDLLSWIPLAGAGTRHCGLSSASAKHSSHGLVLCSNPSRAAHLLGMVSGHEWSENASVWYQKKTKHTFFTEFSNSPHYFIRISVWASSMSYLNIPSMWKKANKTVKNNPQSNIVTFISKYLWMLIFSLYS